MKQRWLIPKPPGFKTNVLSELLAISPVVADILVQRGLLGINEAVDYLKPTMLCLASPFCFKDMDRVIERFTLALKNAEKILVYGDFDVDGVTSTVVLYKTLIELGFNVVTYIPHRQEEGYGLHRETIEKAQRAGVKLIITVDCGISALEEIKFAKESGLDVIITDHHEPPESLPAALAIINPKVSDSGYPFSELAGVGVAFKVAQALLQELRTSETGMEFQKELLDLVALGTIADVVPLIGENRILVYYGLQQMEVSTNLGLEALLAECGLLNKTLKAGTVAFTLAPRINAAGRMDSARPGLELLLTGNPEKAKELARKLSAENTLRQQTEKEILAEAIAQLEEGQIPRVIVLASNWHHGVIGIVASRLVERYHRPVFMISVEDDMAKGSARGIPGYHVLEQLSIQADKLEKFGGHRQAAGFSIATKDIPGLREGLNAQASKLQEEVFQKVINIDGFVALPLLTESLQQELEQLAPFGYGNPGPVLASKQLPIFKISQVGQDGSHLKFNIGPKGIVDGIAFRQGERFSELLAKPQLDLAFSLDLNTFQGRQKLQLIIKDIQEDIGLYDQLRSKDMESIAGSFGELDSAVNLEVAAGLDSIKSRDPLSIEWLDWRAAEQSSWKNAKHIIAHNTVVWDSSVSALFSFHDFCQENYRGRVPEGMFKNSCLNQQFLGIIAGSPLTKEDFIHSIETLLNLGVEKIALTEFKPFSELDLQRRCGYLTREELIQSYRLFLNRAKPGTSFSWTPLENEQNILEALKVFEELGLVRYLGGSNTYELELVPSNLKLDLESSLRYASAKRYWEKTRLFQNELICSSWKELMRLIESMMRQA